MPQLFLDTEFTQLSQSAELLALAFISAENSWFYATFSDTDTSELSDWHRQHVLPHLFLPADQLKGLPTKGVNLSGNRKFIVEKLRVWLSQWSAVEIWADVPAYDWVLFCELFGGALQLPANIHYMVRDLATLFTIKGLDPDTDRFEFAYQGQPPTGVIRHNALGDAFTAKICYDKLIRLP